MTISVNSKIGLGGPVRRASGPRAPRLHARAAGGRVRFVRGTYGLVNRAVQGVDSIACILAPLLLRKAWIVSAEPLTVVQALMIGVLVAIAFSTALRLAGGYRFERYGRPEWSAVDVGLGWLAAVGVVALVLWAFDPVILGAKRWLVSWTLLLLTVLLAERTVMSAVIRRMVRAGALRRQVAVIGDGPLAHDVAARIAAAEPGGGYALAGLFSPEADAASGVDKLCAMATDRQIDQIVIALPWKEAERIFDICEQVQWISADVAALLDHSVFMSRSARSGNVAGAPVMHLSHHPFKGSEGMVKVVEDYAVALVAVVLLAPVMAACAVAVRLSGEGPILFRQPRIGFNGRRFTMLKFRSMTVDASDDGSLGAARNAARITPVGAILRKTSLDELPQLFNVLLGDMSIVGPRPHVPNMFIERKSYAETVRAYAARHRIKPGITGWAQINGMRGGIDSEEKAQRGVELDLFYIKHWSLRRDFRIMLRTVFGNMAGPRVF